MTNYVAEHTISSDAVNIELKDISETRKSLVVTLDKSEVDSEHQAVVGEIAKYARLPGFRPGRAPAELIVKRFAKEVREELKTKVVGKDVVIGGSCHKALPAEPCRQHMRQVSVKGKTAPLHVCAFTFAELTPLLAQLAP